MPRRGRVHDEGRISRTAARISWVRKAGIIIPLVPHGGDGIASMPVIAGPAIADGWASGGVVGGLPWMADSSWRSRLQQSSPKLDIETVPDGGRGPVRAPGYCLAIACAPSLGREGEAAECEDELRLEGTEGTHGCVRTCDSRVRVGEDCNIPRMIQFNAERPSLRPLQPSMSWL